MHLRRMAPSALVFFMGQIFKVKIAAEGKMLFPDKFQHNLAWVDADSPPLNPAVRLGPVFRALGS